MLQYYKQYRLNFIKPVETVVSKDIANPNRWKCLCHLSSSWKYTKEDSKRNKGNIKGCVLETTVYRNGIVIDRKSETVNLDTHDGKEWEETNMIPVRSTS